MEACTFVLKLNTLEAYYYQIQLLDASSSDQRSKRSFNRITCNCCDSFEMDVPLQETDVLERPLVNYFDDPSDRTLQTGRNCPNAFFQTLQHYHKANRRAKFIQSDIPLNLFAC